MGMRTHPESSIELLLGCGQRSQKELTPHAKTMPSNVQQKHSCVMQWPSYLSKVPE